MARRLYLHSLTGIHKVCGPCIVDHKVAILLLCYCINFFPWSLLSTWSLKYGLGSRLHMGVLTPRYIFLQCFSTPGQSVFSGIGPIFPTGSVELNKYSLGKLLCTRGSYCLVVPTILTLNFNYFRATFLYNCEGQY